jgi:hypothetical protein
MANYALQRTPGTFYASTHHRGPAPLNTALCPMSERCENSEYVRQDLRSIWRQSVPCSRCGKPLRLRPDVSAAVNILAIILATGVGVTIGPGTWQAAAAALAAAFAAYVLLSYCAVRFVGLLHVSPVDASASTYRVLIALMLLVAVLMLVLALGLRKGA